MTAMFCFFAMPQVMLDPSSPSRDGTPGPLQLNHGLLSIGPLGRSHNCHLWKTYHLAKHVSKSPLCAGSLNPIITVPIVLIGKLRLRKARDPPQVTQQVKGRPRIHFP